MTSDVQFEESLGDLVGPGDVLASKYRVDEVLAVGGMGVVVKAWHTHFDERVALKFLHPRMGADTEALVRFEREARAAFKIKSEHVARVLDVGKLDGGAPYMVMEFLEGEDLAQLLERGAALSVADAVGHVLQACEAVAEAHALGIVHRDLKPENMFCTRRTDGSVCIKVLDFGLSKAETSAQGEGRQRALTDSAQVMGTPQYMSPEQWMSARDVGPATDQWALGVILYELLTGQQPFQGAQIAQLCTLVLNGAPPPLLERRPDVPRELESIILRCLEKDPAARYANVGDLAVQLAAFAPGQGRMSAKRVIGVFEKVGVHVEEPLPPSTRTPGGGIGVAGSGAGPAPLAPVPSARASVAERQARAAGDAAWSDVERENERRAGGGATGVVVVAALILLLGAAGAVAWVMSQEPETASPAAPAPSALRAASSTRAEAAPSPSEAASGAAPSASAATKPAPRRGRFSGRRRPIRPRPVVGSKPKPSAAPAPRDIFGDR